MSEFYVGQIILAAFMREMRGWKICDGSLLAIAEFPELFDVIGTTYGGDGEESFALPDLRGRLPIGEGRGGYLGASSFFRGEILGQETVTLSMSQLPEHRHAVNAATDDAVSLQLTPASVFAACVAANARHYVQSIPAGAPWMEFNSQSIQQAGGGAPHNNIMPSMALCYQICVHGFYGKHEGGLVND